MINGTVIGDDYILAKAKGIQAPVRDALIIELALNTGLRVSELSNLKVEHLYLKKGQNSLIVRNGKGGKDRIVQFGPGLKNQILEYMDYRTRRSEYLFTSHRGDQLTSSGIQQVFKKYARKAKLPSHYSIHSLRHTYATNLYKASGYNLRMVQKQLGHASITTTMAYSDVIGQDLDDAIQALETEE
ncbi:MAG: tyrosine-type recombinase/integrase [Candidatus Marinimicrobia bacterium]|nr:tyrosine-type recombinase/integrase [Candidatus Neomarinimicrobiota bacterium]